MLGLLSWTLLMTIVAMVAVLLLLTLSLRTRRSTTEGVRLKLAETQKPRSLRGSRTFLRRKPTGGNAMFEGMDAAEFEARVSQLFRELGYSVRPTPPSNLHDVDLLLESTSRKVAVQIKRWKAPVGDRSIYGLFTGRIHYATDEAWLLTTSEFTRKAVKLAQTTGVRLVDGAQLAGWIASREERFSVLSENDPESPARPAHSSLRPSEDAGGAEADASAQESTGCTQETQLGRT